jgi:PAS domain S-box-containing protein
MAQDAELYQYIFSQSPSFIAILRGQDHVYEKVNDNYLKLVGNRSLLGISVQEALPEAKEQGFIALLDKVYQTGETFFGSETKIAIKQADGSFKNHYLDFIYQPLRDQSHLIVGIFVHGIDVTEKVNARIKQEESEKEIQVYAEAMPHMAFIADAEGNITYFNERFYQYIGLKNDVQGWGWKDQQIHHPDDLERTVQTWQAALKSGENYHIEYRLRRHDGAYRWHIGHAVPYKNNQGEILRWYGTNIDIEEERQAQSKIKKMTESMQKALSARDEFLSVASHELKTPLTSIKLQLLLIRKGLENHSDKMLLHFAKQADKQASRLTTLIDDMLDITRVRSGQLSINTEEVNLSILIHEVLDRLEPQFKDKNLALPQVESSGDIKGSWDKLRLEQVMINLLTNALRYGERKPITIGISRKADLARISIRDEGPGIDETQKQKIFERFERGSESSKAVGLGLGLFISLQIVEAHGGRMWVESELGKGSTFYVELPIKSSGSL